MYQFWYIALTFFLLQDLQFVITQSCGEETDTVNGKNEIKWPRSNSSSSVLSDPPCVNARKMLVKRTCSNGKWLPQKHECVSVQQAFNPKCKGNDKFFQNYCFYIRENKKWTSNTPVVDIEPLTDKNISGIFTEFIKNQSLTITKVWLPVKRNEKYGKFVWKIPKTYLERFQNYTNTSYLDKPEYILHECMSMQLLTTDNKIFIPQDCNMKLTIVHIYKPESSYLVNAKPLFYSTGNNNVYFKSENCTLLAEPKTIEVNFLIKKLVGNQTCRIGIKRDHNKAFIWENNSKVINYTDWISATNFNNSVVVISADGWKLENSTKEVTCSVCQIDHTNYKTELKFGLNINQTELIITAYSHQTISLIGVRTIGLEDMDIYAKFDEISVNNDFSKVKNKWEKLDLRQLWRVRFQKTTSNYYYLSALSLPYKQEINTDQIFFRNNETGGEYAFTIKIEKICKIMYCDPHVRFKNGNDNNYKRIAKFLLLRTHMLQVNQDMSSEEDLTNQFINITRIRAIKILKIDKNGSVEILLHLHTNNTNTNITAEHKIIQKLLRKLHNNLSNLVVRNTSGAINFTISNDQNRNIQTFKIKINNESVKSCMGCLNEQTFDKDKKEKFNWEFTEIGQKRYTLDCSRLQRDKFYFSRKCGGDHLNGAKWEKPNIHYEDISKYSKYTTKLCNIYDERSNLTVNQVLSTLSNITSNNMNIKATDIYYISEIFQNVTSTTKQIELLDRKSVAKDATLLISNLLTVNKSSLEESNSTNKFLAQVEELLPSIAKNDSDLDDSGVYKIVEDNFMYSRFNPFISNITGIALIKPNTSDNNSSPFTKYNITYLQANADENEITGWENLDSAIFVPQQLLEHVKNTTNSTARISISIFYNDSLFIESKNITKKSKLLTKVFSVIIHGYENYLVSPLPIISRVENSVHSKQPCGFWDFGIHDNTPRWVKEINKDTTLIPETHVQICYFKHLTHFAFLLGKTDDVLSSDENRKLEMITAVGCLLSVTGICGIFLTALIFRSWRQKVGTKIILNVSTCILLQLILLYLNMKYTDIICVITGSLLHYSVLCGFSWSLIMAFLQYLKFVRVLGGQTPHLLLKASIVGWFLPMIPVTISIVYSYMTKGQYMANMEQMGSNICYPQGVMLYLTLLLPVCLIVIGNLIIFVLIFYNVSWRPKIRNNLNEKKFYIQQVKLAIFLFFLLGLTWISGLITIIYHSIEFLYIFSATASLQGFVLFLFYVLLDHGTRGLWWKKLKQTSQSSKVNYQSQSNSQQVSQPVSNTFISTTKEESGVSMSEVAEWNIRSQAVMQELDVTHRLRKK